MNFIFQKINYRIYLNINRKLNYLNYNNTKKFRTVQGIYTQLKNWKTGTNKS